MPKADGMSYFTRPDGSLCYVTFNPTPTVPIDYHEATKEELRQVAALSNSTLDELELDMSLYPEQEQVVAITVAIERLQNQGTPSGVSDDIIYDLLKKGGQDSSFESMVKFRYMLYSLPEARTDFIQLLENQKKLLVSDWEGDATNLDSGNEPTSDTFSYREPDSDDFEMVNRVTGLPTQMLEMIVTMDMPQAPMIRQIIAIERLRQNQDPSGFTDDQIREYLNNIGKAATYDDILSARRQLHTDFLYRDHFVSFAASKYSH